MSKILFEVNYAFENKCLKNHWEFFKNLTAKQSNQRLLFEPQIFEKTNADIC